MRMLEGHRGILYPGIQSVISGRPAERPRGNGGQPVQPAGQSVTVHSDKGRTQPLISAA